MLLGLLHLLFEVLEQFVILVKGFGLIASLQVEVAGGRGRHRQRGLVVAGVVQGRGAQDLVDGPADLRSRLVHHLLQLLLVLWIRAQTQLKIVLKIIVAKVIVQPPIPAATVGSVLNSWVVDVRRKLVGLLDQ